MIKIQRVCRVLFTFDIDNELKLPSLEKQINQFGKGLDFCKVTMGGGFGYPSVLAEHNDWPEIRDFVEKVERLINRYKGGVIHD